MTAPDQQPHTDEGVPARLYLDKSAPEDFVNVKKLDWIYLVGDISTDYELKFVHRFGEALKQRDAAIAAAARAEGARQERERVLDKLDYFVCSCQELHAPDCNGSEEGIKDCDGCGMFESATIEQIREYIKELR